MTLFSWFPSGYRGKPLWCDPWLLLSSLESFWTNAYNFQATPGIFCSPRFSSNASLWLESLFHTTHLLNALASRITCSVKLPWQPSAPSSLSQARRIWGLHWALAALPLTHGCTWLFLWSPGSWDHVLLFFLFKSSTNTKNQQHCGSLSICWMKMFPILE